MARCVVVSAAEIKNYEKVKSYFKSDDFFVFCDGGLNHIKKLGNLGYLKLSRGSATSPRSYINICLLNMLSSS